MFGTQELHMSFMEFCRTHYNYSYKILPPAKQRHAMDELLDTTSPNHLILSKQATHILLMEIKVSQRYYWFVFIETGNGWFIGGGSSKRKKKIKWSQLIAERSLARTEESFLLLIQEYMTFYTPAYKFLAVMVLLSDVLAKIAFFPSYLQK